MTNLHAGMSRSEIGAYVLGTLGLSWVVQVPAIFIFGLESEITKIAFVLTMWSPTLLALLVLKHRRSARTGVRWRLGTLRYLPVGVVAETLVAFGTLAILMAAGFAASGWFEFGPDAVSISGGPWVLGTGGQTWLFFVTNVLATAATFSIVGLIAATGEEFAWRGFLQGHLERQYGVLPAILRVAIVWWAWHLPGLLAGYNFPETPLLGAFILFPLQMLGTSLFFGWLTIRSNSFWAAALAHAAVNSIQQGVFDNLRLHGPALPAHATRTALILCLGLMCLPALIRIAAGERGPEGERKDAEGYGVPSSPAH